MKFSSVVLILFFLLTLAAGTELSNASSLREFKVDLSDQVTGKSLGLRTYRHSSNKPFSLVGFSWRGSRDVKISIRTRIGAGKPSRWVAVPTSQEDGPDTRRSTKFISAPVWVGKATAVEVKASPDLRGLVAHFVDPVESSSVARDAHSSVLRTGKAFIKATAAGLSAQPPIIPRSQWAGDQCPPRANPSYGKVQIAFVHHTVSINNYSPSDSFALVLAICAYHRDTKGWNDIGYNFLVDKYGQIFEGRAGGMDKAVVGAQAEGYNSVSTGVANVGTFDSSGQSAQAIDALAKLLAWKLSLSSIDPNASTTVTSNGGSTNRYPSGASVVLKNISGHRDGDSTECPGNALYDQLPALRAAVASYLRGASSAAASYRVSLRVKRAGKNRALLSGQLKRVDKTSPGTQAIQLQVKKGNTFKLVRRVATGTDGTWSTAINSRKRRIFRVAFSDGGKQSVSRQLAVGQLP